MSVKGLLSERDLRDAGLEELLQECATVSLVAPPNRLQSVGALALSEPEFRSITGQVVHVKLTPSEWLSVRDILSRLEEKTVPVIRLLHLLAINCRSGALKMPSWAWARTGSYPRFAWDDARYPPSLFFPWGMSPRWMSTMTREGLYRYLKDIQWGMPAPLLRGGFPGFVGRNLSKLIPVRLHRPDAGVVEPDAYESNLPQPVTKHLSKEQLCGSWLAHRTLTGMTPPALVAVQGRDNEYEVRYSFARLPFGPAPGQGTASPYILPDVAVRLLIEDDKAVVERVRIAYRKPGSACQEYEEPIEVIFANAPLWKRFRAARIAASAMFLRGQIDQHISKGHIMPEILAVAMMRTLSEDHPVRLVLQSRLDEVTSVNHGADGAIWGEYGVMTVCSPLTPGGIEQAIADRIGAMDWLGYKPPSVQVCTEHYAPTVMTEYWEEVRDYVSYALGSLGGGIDKWYRSREPVHLRWQEELRSLFSELAGLRVDSSVPDGQWDAGFAGESGVVIDDGEFKKPGSGHFLSYLRNDADVGMVVEDTQQLCSFAVFLATMGHAWANTRQTQDVGDPDFAMFCLRLRIDDPAYADPLPMDPHWNTDARPYPCDIAYQRAAGAILTLVNVDNFQNELAGSGDPDVAQDPIQGPESLAARTQRWVKSMVGRTFHSVHPETKVNDLQTYLSRCNR